MSSEDCRNREGIGGIHCFEEERRCCRSLAPGVGKAVLLDFVPYPLKINVRLVSVFVFCFLFSF